MNDYATLPSVDRLMRSDQAQDLIEAYGRPMVLERMRCQLDIERQTVADGGTASSDAVLKRVADDLALLSAPSLRPVFNLTGTVLHTNLGRAPLPRSALEAIADVAGGASNLEFDLAKGRRGDRDDHVVSWLCRLTGAEDATVVNNNAAAVLLCLNTLARRKEVIVSRGELVEIGGSFRIPDVMARAGSKLREVGTTNRTHGRDYAGAVDTRTAMIMRVHTSNYQVQGFTKSVPDQELAEIARTASLPFVVDLGSGALTDLSKLGLPAEPTVRDTLAQGADLVTFSGDKLLGGPQAGLIAGRRDLIKKLKKNPMKRALRVDKMTLAALSAILPLYANPDRITDEVPALKLLTRTQKQIASTADIVIEEIRAKLGDRFVVEKTCCRSQIGSGAQPVELLDSAAIRLTPRKGKKSGGRMLNELSSRLRRCPIPVIGRVEKGAFWLDCRCLTDHSSFLEQIADL